MKREKLTTKESSVYTVSGKFMFSVSMTNEAKALLNDEYWDKGKESWLDYRNRTKKERELEQQKQYKLTEDIANAYNEKYNL
jgi:dihydroneopterin aldolase